MKLLVTAATKLELLPIKGPLRKAKIPGLSVDFLVTGIGPYETLHSLTKYLKMPFPSSKEGARGRLPDLIINIGIAGYTSPQTGLTKSSNENSRPVGRGDIYQIARVIQAHTNKERVLALHLKDLPAATCICSDTPIKSEEVLSKFLAITSRDSEIRRGGSEGHVDDSSGNWPLVTGNCLVDMESWSVCWLAEKYNISKVLLKIAYDRVGKETEKFDKHECEKFLEEIELGNIIEQIKGLL